MTLTIDISRAENIAGWMSSAELTWLAERASEHKMIVELGSYLGRSTRALGDHTPGVVYAVDDFQGPMDVNLPYSEREKLYPTFRRNLRDLILSGKVIDVKLQHENAGLFANEKMFDMVFIDGDHEYWCVRQDIKTFLPHVSPGGLICGHDYSQNFPGVMKAVKELLPDAFPVCETIWAYEVP